MARTPNFGFDLIDFDKRPWIGPYHDNLRLVDAVLAQFVGIENIKGVWQNATIVVVGSRYADPDLGTIFEVLVAHTTPSTGKFEAARDATSGQWKSITASLASRGACAVNTA